MNVHQSRKVKVGYFGRRGIRTLAGLEDVQVVVVGRLTMRRQRVLAVSEKVRAYLRVAERLHVLFRSVYASARLFEADDVDGFVGGAVGVLAG